MKIFQFTIARDRTEYAMVMVEAKTIEKAHNIAMRRGFDDDWYFEPSDETDDTYLPDSDDYEEVVPTPEDSDISISDWKYDVANGDTKLGYADWVNHNLEEAS